MKQSLQQLGIQTAQNDTDKCAPNGFCVSSVQYAKCICDPKYYGDRCQYSKICRTTR